jgi:hypothetical protein
MIAAAEAVFIPEHAEAAEASDLAEIRGPELLGIQRTLTRSPSVARVMCAHRAVRPHTRGVTSDPTDVLAWVPE